MWPHKYILIASTTKGKKQGSKKSAVANCNLEVQLKCTSLKLLNYKADLGASYFNESTIKF